MTKSDSWTNQRWTRENSEPITEGHARAALQYDRLQSHITRKSFVNSVGIATLLESCTWIFRLKSFDSMKSICAFCTLAVASSFLLVSGAEKKDDVGTVIGIDLGTTYSW